MTVGDSLQPGGNETHRCAESLPVYIETGTLADREKPHRSLSPKKGATPVSRW